jgi:polysaccharide pyruvyl transferase WcaK-like protein
MVDYICWSKDKENLKRATSGGIMFELARYIITELDGKVVGVKRDGNWDIASTLEEVKKFQGSKYFIPKGLKKVVSLMNEDRGYILFVGTPCQVELVKIYCRDRLDKIILVTLLCHGYHKTKQFDRCNHKQDGWSNSWKQYPKDYLGFKNLKKQCQNCLVSRYNGDITIGDGWGCPKHLINEYGTSRIRINTLRGNGFMIGVYLLGNIVINAENIIDKGKIALLDVHDYQNFGNCILSTNFIHYMSKFNPEQEYVFVENRHSYAPDMMKQMINDNKVEYRSLPLLEEPGIVAKVKGVIWSLIKGGYDTNGIIDCDTVVVLGGDCFSGNWHWRWLRWTLFFSRCHRVNKKVVFISNTIGNFPLYIRLFGKNIWRKINFIIRDDWSMEQLEKFGCKNVFKTTDIGILDLPNQKKIKKKSYVVLSPSFIWEKYASSYEDYLNYMEAIYYKLMYLNKGNTIIMPHTTDEKGIRIAEELARRTNYQLYLPKNPLDARHFLQSAKFVVTCRMHCAVQAIQGKVPTIVIGYSEKYKNIIEKELQCTNKVATMKNILQKIDEEFNKTINPPLDSLKHLAETTFEKLLEIICR